MFRSEGWSSRPFVMFSALTHLSMTKIRWNGPRQCISPAIPFMTVQWSMCLRWTLKGHSKCLGLSCGEALLNISKWCFWKWKSYQFSLARPTSPSCALISLDRTKRSFSRTVIAHTWREGGSWRSSSVKWTLALDFWWNLPTFRQQRSVYDRVKTPFFPIQPHTTIITNRMSAQRERESDARTYTAYKSLSQSRR